MIYSNIKSKLEALKIHNYDDYAILSKYWREELEKLENQGNKIASENIEVLRNIVIDARELLGTRMSDIKGQVISIDSDNVNFDANLDKYICFFPNRTLIETETLMRYEDMSEWEDGYINYNLPPDDFFKNYFHFEKIIERNIAHLYPIKNIKNTEGPISYIDCKIIDELQNVASVYTNPNLRQTINRQDLFYVAFPWLYNVHTEDFIEICDKFPLEFQCFSFAIEKISRASNATEDINEILLRDLKEALINIQIQYEKKKSQLKRKGIITSIGIMLTFIPYTLASFFKTIDLSLYSKIMGGATLYGGFDLLNNFFDVKKESNHNPYWVIWKWSQKK